MNCRCYLSLVNPSPKTSGKTLCTCHCQEEMETPSIIPNWVLALPHAWAEPSAAQHRKATAWSRYSQWLPSAVQLRTSSSSELNVPEVQCQKEQGLIAALALLSSMKRSDRVAPSVSEKSVVKKKIKQMLFTLRGEWNSNVWEDIKKLEYLRL